ncbi:Chloramphenicol resistance pump Cmr [Legionella massiliensis]|uniref:Multidrug transporter MdfA n=1 Tax=Legionella massiliensis TaxID=1034943 RepID=A0A078L403_9GAMM|nr:MFS transporter [Legionella massiliensis]CDZ78663.1 Chloramphenicol resistance pump Cmr [Legionella massiliensis]CEE14401.1 Multidrug transporter MdfA [Legionella massiliensis]
MDQPLINISRKHALLFACFLVFYEFLTYIANDMIMPGMIKVVESFNGPETAIATSLTAYVLGGASLQLFLGPISDRYGRRPVMLFGASLFLICTILIACSNSIGHFLIARFFQGMGLCFIGVIGYATLQEIFSEMDAVRLIALMANVSTTAPLLGPLLGAAFIHYFSWRLIFVLIGFFALITLWGLWRFMPEPVGQLKRDGERINPVSLAPKIIATNYLNLLKNIPFMLGSTALGLMVLPCLAWIALAPVILVTDAKLTVIQYALWQIPVFGATILGNWFLQHLSYRGSLRKILMIGSIIIGIGLLAGFILPLAISNYFVWLMPGLIIYFFGLGVAGAPLNRLILFSTPVGKGTASALMSMISMLIQALGIEGANYIYLSHNNLLFGLLCALIGLAYIVFLVGLFLLTGSESQDIDPNSPSNE